MTDYGWVRVSAGSQDAQTQERDIKAGYPQALIVRPDTKAASASKGEQLDALDALIAKLRPGDKVIMTDSSRLDRREDLDEQAATVTAIRQAGAEIVSLRPGEENFGKGKTLPNILLTVVAQHANAEKSKTVKEQTWRGVRAVIANGAFYGALPVFWKSRGERYAKQAYCADPDAVRAVYVAVRDGKSLSSIARNTTPKTYPQSIRTLIECEANKTGVFTCSYTHQGEKTTWEHASAGPVVTKELWHAANKAMKARGEALDNRGGRPVNKATSWVSGLLDCPGCDGHLYVSRGKSLRCGGKGKERLSCGVAGIPLGYVEAQLDEICGDEMARVYRYSKIAGNQAELDEMTVELERVKSTLATSDDDDVSALVSRRKELRDAIAAFVLEPDRYDMTATGETLAGLWRTGDRRVILKSLKQHITFHVAWGNERGKDGKWVPSVPQVTGFVHIEGYYPGETLIELTPEICVKMTVQPRSFPTPA